MSAAIKTAGWHSAHQERRSGESVHWELMLRPNSGPRRVPWRCPDAGKAQRQRKWCRRRRAGGGTAIWVSWWCLSLQSAEQGSSASDIQGMLTGGRPTFRVGAGWCLSAQRIPGLRPPVAESCAHSGEFTQGVCAHIHAWHVCVHGGEGGRAHGRRGAASGWATGGGLRSAPTGHSHTHRDV